VKITAGGNGYTSAPTVTFSSGSATAIAYVAGESVIGVAMESLGSGYTSVPTVTFSGGGGTGATATAFVGIPTPTNRNLRVICQSAITFASSGSSPSQVNWTGSPITIPAGTDIEWLFSGGATGHWTALNFQLESASIESDGAGRVALRSVSGNVALYPGGTGAVQWVSDTHTAGCTTTIGSGSPEGVVTASPGSDYRNLTGAAGSVFWIKQTGAGNTDWVALV
jgi:hypothetical protein